VIVTFSGSLVVVVLSGAEATFRCRIALVHCLLNNSDTSSLESPSATDASECHYYLRDIRLVDEPQHTGDDVVEVYGTADFLAFAYPLSGSVNTVASVRGFLLPAPADRCPS
jgi:hypothetical protein